MKFLPAMFAALLILSCSGSDKFSGENNQRIRIEGIDYDYEIDGSQEIYLFGILNSEIESCVSSNNRGTCFLNDYFWIINDKACISLENLDACQLSGYSWIIDNETVASFENPYDIGYGEHTVKLVLVDIFGDSISNSIHIRVNEPLKVQLLSPIKGFSLQEADSLVFQYKISGVDSWEEVQSFVYVSADKSSLWEKENILDGNVLKQPFAESRYFWGVVAHTNYDGSDTSAIWHIGD